MHFSQLSQASQDCIIETFLDGEFSGELTEQMKTEIAEWARDDSVATTEEVRRILGHDNAGADLPPPATPDSKESHPGG